MSKVRSARTGWLNSSALSLAASLSVAGAVVASAGAAQAQNSFLNIGDMTTTPSISINNNFTPVQAYDPTNVTGIGQIVVDAGGGSVGTCTGTLVNRRTVIFAAHCVNTRAQNVYGSSSGGTAIAAAFETNTRANAAGQTDELVNWLLGSGTGPGRFQTNTAQSLYNMNQVFWNAASKAPASCTNATSCFLEADIALGVLDTAANNVPQWTMLFSALPTPGAIDPANGTGYHVSITGYGAYGNGTTGSTTSGNWRRRVAENMLGALVSFNTRNQFLFGTAGTPSRPQLTYMIDFDDPTRTNTRDFNGFRDNALTREGTTGPGDSGGPLILDQAYARPTIIGVLSGGSTFYTGQPGGSYGTQAFYQPLFLYWDWIAANNPYRYATAKAGDGAWEDASRWVTELDPAYQIISGGQLVNGLPTNPGEGLNSTNPGFGELCFQSTTSNECQNIATGQARNNVPNNPAGGSDTVNGEVVISRGGESVETVSEADAGIEGSGRLTGSSIETAHADGDVVVSPLALPAATLANGLPGATNFTPNNVDGGGAIISRYYDITLRNAGTTSLSSTVTIDRFAVAGSSSGLNINTNGSLTSLSDITQTSGRINVDGALRSVGDYAIIGGLLSGRGTVTTPFLTSVLGTIAPGTLGTVGTLTVAGNVILSSGSQLAIDVGSTTSDRLVAVAGAGQTGSINLGGTLNLNVVGTPTFGQQYLIVSAAGGVTSQFNALVDLPGVLRPTLTYTATSASVTLVADSYLNFVDPNSPSQASIGALLDRSRAGSYAQLSSIYSTTDLLQGQALGTVLESLAPYTAQSALTLGVMPTETLQSVVSGRIGMDRSDGGSTGLSVFGGGVQVAALNESLAPIAAGAARKAQDEAQRRYWTGGWKEGVAGFLSISRTDGEGRQLPGTVIGSGLDDSQTYAYSGGLERTGGNGLTIGAAVSYADGDANYRGGLGQTDTDQLQGTLYGSAELAGTAYVGAHVGYGVLDIETQRSVLVGPAILRTAGETDGDVFMAGFEVGARPEMGGAQITPFFGMNHYNLSVDGYTETGSAAAMTIGETEVTSTQAFLGVRVSGEFGTESFPIRPILSVRGIADLDDGDSGFTAAFAGTGVQPVTFVGTERDDRWIEATAGVQMGGERLNLRLEASSMLAREDVDYDTYKATLSFRF